MNVPGSPPGWSRSQLVISNLKKKKKEERHVVLTNLSQDTAGRRRWRDAGAVRMEDAVRREPLFNPGNLATMQRAHFGIRT